MNKIEVFALGALTGLAVAFVIMLIFAAVRGL